MWRTRTLRLERNNIRAEAAETVDCVLQPAARKDKVDHGRKAEAGVCGVPRLARLARLVLPELHRIVLVSEMLICTPG